MFNEKIITDKSDREERLRMMRENIAECRPEPHSPGPRHPHPIPPHERKDMVFVEFDEDCENLFKDITGSEEEAEVAMEILHCAPPELQVIAVQLLKMNGVNAKARFPKFKGVFPGWRSPMIGREMYELYSNIYGENGENYVEVLETSPYEIAVISRMLAYMQEKRGE